VAPYTESIGSFPEEVNQYFSEEIKIVDSSRIKTLAKTKPPFGGWYHLSANILYIFKNSTREKERIKEEDPAHINRRYQC
jgi:hypothetical protein